MSSVGRCCRSSATPDSSPRADCVSLLLSVRRVSSHCVYVCVSLCVCISSSLRMDESMFVSSLSSVSMSSSYGEDTRRLDFCFLLHLRQQQQTMVMMMSVARRIPPPTAMISTMGATPVLLPPSVPPLLLRSEGSFRMNADVCACLSLNTRHADTFVERVYVPTSVMSVRMSWADVSLSCTLSEYVTAGASSNDSCTARLHGMRHSPLNAMRMVDPAELAVALERCGMKKGDEREERTFPESEHSDDERIHIDFSVCSLSLSPLSSMSLSLSLCGHVE